MNRTSRWIRHCVVGMCLPLLIATSVAAQDSEKEEGEDKIPGIKVGEKAPEFKLHDPSGKERTFKELLKASKDGPIALVFYRSADW